MEDIFVIQTGLRGSRQRYKYLHLLDKEKPVLRIGKPVIAVKTGHIVDIVSANEAFINLTFLRFDHLVNPFAMPEHLCALSVGQGGHQDVPQRVKTF